MGNNKTEIHTFKEIKCIQYLPVFRLTQHIQSNSKSTCLASFPELFLKYLVFGVFIYQYKEFLLFLCSPLFCVGDIHKYAKLKIQNNIRRHPYVMQQAIEKNSIIMTGIQALILMSRNYNNVAKLFCRFESYSSGVLRLKGILNVTKISVDWRSEEGNDAVRGIIEVICKHPSCYLCLCNRYNSSPTFKVMLFVVSC